MYTFYCSSVLNFVIEIALNNSRVHESVVRLGGENGRARFISRWLLRQSPRSTTKLHAQQQETA